MSYHYRKGNRVLCWVPGNKDRQVQGTVVAMQGKRDVIVELDGEPIARRFPLTFVEPAPVVKPAPAEALTEAATVLEAKHGAREKAAAVLSEDLIFLLEEGCGFANDFVRWLRSRSDVGESHLADEVEAYRTLCADHHQATLAFLEAQSAAAQGNV